ncbi:chorismate--pyruvate lyase family protein [Methanolobus profundi]|uniref:4-hydroxybenzoate synthetase (Chorismate-pyruvate lyase) n=1 Tax=Methanolobus profundi TaxID=487685 RepID=A0A1I4NLR8_9EURY|nr:chorismate pyruvate-lyase family protein [Methanolobus profundi]SFM16290.1 4-hydroxybenzoate synthetase (chorismate-pyruvate lyase) [Methanolobus profundi]
MEFLEKLKSFEIPTCLRVCAGTDGSVTFLLEIMTKHPTAVVTEYQHIIPADEKMADIFGVDVGADINERVVTLIAGDTPYVFARSLSAIENMPDVVRCDLMKADIPIGRILRDHNIETRRDFESIDIEDDEPLFGAQKVLSRSYRIVHHNGVLMWINEKFPVDDRWCL